MCIIQVNTLKTLSGAQNNIDPVRVIFKVSYKMQNGLCQHWNLNKQSSNLNTSQNDIILGLNKAGGKKTSGCQIFLKSTFILLWIHKNEC